MVRPERGGERALLLALLALLLAACPESSGKTGVPGESGLALFSAETDLVFEHRLLVGSTFELSALARRPTDEASVLGATFVSSDEEVLVVGETELDEPADGDEGHARVETQVSVSGKGEAYLELERDGEVLDRFLFKAAEADVVDLLDVKVLGSSVDARVPELFGVVDRGPVSLALAAVDRCGGPLLPFHAGQLTAVELGTPEGEEPVPSSWVSVAPADGGAFEISGALDDENPLAPRRAELLLEVPGIAEAQRFEVHVVPASGVDDVEAVVATAEPGKAEIWGRAFADDIEVLGLDFSWSATPRVTLGRREGPNVIAEVSFPAEGEPEDDRPAEVTAKAFGEEGTVNLFGLMSEDDLLATRVPPREQVAPPPGPSCGGGAEACDPYGAGLGVMGLLVLRLSRRRRTS